MTDMNEAIEHIKFTVRHSPSVYSTYRDQMVEMLTELEQAETKHQAMEKENGN